ncbi:ankyrin repeat-containing domain protein [Cadophora sp. MPI-SDFR-AT-0126]|nr:ankyrin repeat-containing domain protein [Leotiomycetes sp. MPI-SDFR-AT-0126]
MNHGKAAFHDGPLVYAAIGGQYRLIARILDAREAVSLASDRHEVIDAFRAAINWGFTRIVELLLHRCPALAEPHLACLAARTNQLDIFKLLCPILDLPLGDFAFLTDAAGSGHLDFVSFCLENGASPIGNDVPSDELMHLRIPIQVACSRGYREVVKLLLKHGANPLDEQDRRHALPAAASGGYWRLVQDLLTAGAVACHNYRHSPLIVAVRNGQAKVVEVLLDSGIELWYKDWALCKAAEAGYDTIVRLLVERGAKIDAIDQYDMWETPIIHAMINGHPHVVRTLLKLGAKPVCPYPISNHSGVLELWKYPRVERYATESAVCPPA